MALDKNFKTLIIYLTFFNLILILIYLVKKPSIALLLIKISIILAKLANFFNIFLKKKIFILLKQIKPTNILSSYKIVNNYIII